MSSEAKGTGGRGSVYPRSVLLFSGKRKCGKDYITDILLERIGSEKAVILKISSPIKSYWAETKGLQLEQLMSADKYKEQHRRDMIIWSEALRNKDPGCFCRKAVAMNQAQEKPIWIVSDIRRQTDIAWFRQEYKGAIQTIRVLADEDIRSNRGYVFTPGVDDVASECDLDNVTDWDFQICNNGSKDELEKSIDVLMKHVESVLRDL